MQEEEAYGLFDFKKIKETVSGKSESELRVLKYINEDMVGEDILLFGGSSGTIKENLLSNYKYRYTYLKS